MYIPTLKNKTQNTPLKTCYIKLHKGDGKKIYTCNALDSCFNYVLTLKGAVSWGLKTPI